MEDHRIETVKSSQIYSLGEENIPTTEQSEWEGSDEMKCHAATTGSILDLVGDRVHG